MMAGSSATISIGIANPAKAGRAVLALTMATALGACAVSTPIAIDSTGAPAGATIQVEMAPTQGDSSDRAAFANALSAALIQRNVDVSQGASLLADFSISVADADAGLVLQENGKQSEADTIDWTSEPRNRKLFDACSPERIRASLVLINRETGQIAYRGSATKLECRIDDGAIAAVADALAKDVTEARP